MWIEHDEFYVIELIGIDLIQKLCDFFGSWVKKIVFSTLNFYLT